MSFADIHGAGLGLRRSLIPQLMAPGGCEGIDFFELAPENWIKLGGRYAERLRYFSDHYPLVSHGLSLSIGGQDPLDFELLKDIKQFLGQYKIRYYTEHLSFNSHQGQLYDLLPIPFTKQAIEHVVGRICTVQDFLERQIALENVSYYLAPSQDMKEIDFLLEVLERSDCQLLLDINNVYVNSVNQGYEPKAFLDRIPRERIAYAHIAGHVREAEDLCIDTHGEPIVDDVWQVAHYCYQRFGQIPTLLERDFNLPPLGALKNELNQVRKFQDTARSAVAI